MRTGNAGHSVDVLTGTLQRDRGLVRGEVCLEQTPQPPSSSARRPIRALAVAATDKWAAGNQEPTAGIGRREARYLAARRRPGEVAARRRSWIAAQWCALHRPAPRASPAGHPPPAVHPHPHAGGRGDGQGRLAAEPAVGVRSWAPRRRSSAASRPAAAGAATRWCVRAARRPAIRAPRRADFGHPEDIARRTRATGVQAARWHHGGVAARRRSRVTGTKIVHHPPTDAHTPSARGRSRTDSGTAGQYLRGLGSARYADKGLGDLNPVLRAPSKAPFHFCQFLTGRNLNPPSGGSAWRSTELLGFEYTAGGAFHFCPLLTWKESHPAFGG